MKAAGTVVGCGELGVAPVQQQQQQQEESQSSGEVESGTKPADNNDRH